MLQINIRDIMDVLKSTDESVNHGKPRQTIDYREFAIDILILIREKEIHELEVLLDTT